MTNMESHLLTTCSPLSSFSPSALLLAYTSQRALSAQTKKWKSAIAELRIREMDMKTKNASVDDLKQSLVETRKELAKEVKDSGGGGGAATLDNNN